MIVLTALLLAASAQECGTGSDLDIATCWDAAYRRADADLNKLWPSALKSARNADRAFSATQRRDKPSAAKDLLASQRAWVTFRDAQCAAQGDYAQGGSLEDIIVAQCKAEMTRKRTKQLQDINADFRER